MTEQMRQFRNYITLLLALPAILAAQGSISVQSQVDKSSLYIGDVVQYSVIVTHDEDVQLYMPELAKNLGMFELRDYAVQDPRKEDGKIISRTDYSLSTFDTGEFEIPELSIGYTTKADSVVRFIKTEPLMITVQSLSPETDGDIRDIKPPRLPDRDLRSYIFLGLIGMLILAALAAAWYFYRRYRQGETLLPARSKPKPPAHIVALEALQALVDSDLLETDQTKAYYSELSDIIRNYIHERFFIDALEMTTWQLLGEMKKHGMQQNEIEMMDSFLNGCDLVKFAKYVPKTDENEVYTQLAFDYVNQTKMVIEEEPETGFEPDEETALAESAEAVEAGAEQLPAAELPEKRQEGSDV